MKLAARILAAMAVVAALAITSVVTRDQLPDASADTGVINALNVGTCYATDPEAFTFSLCEDGGTGDYSLAGTTEITEADPLFATYAVDPKTSADGPRAIVLHSDLLRVSVSDPGRDKREGVLYAVADTAAVAQQRGVLLAGSADVGGYQDKIRSALGLDAPITAVASTNAWFDVQRRAAGAGEGVITSPLRTQLTLSSTTTPADTYANPIAPIFDEGDGMKPGRVKLFGFVAPDADMMREEPASVIDDFQDLEELIDIDEDYGCRPKADAADPDRDCARVAPWIRVGFDLPTGQNIHVMYVYYETSKREELIGGRMGVQAEAGDEGVFYANHGETCAASGANSIQCAIPEFVEDDEELIVEARSDGTKESRNLWLRETGRFTGTYVGYLRLTDSNGDGTEALDEQNRPASSDWGRTIRHGQRPDARTTEIEATAVLGVESGPVTIRYQDTDEDLQTLVINVDTAPPGITIDTPANETATRDASPNFSGTFDDGGSGLRESSFRLYADNERDDDESGEGRTGSAGGRSVLDLKVYPDQGRTRAFLEDRRGVVIEPPVDPIEIAGAYTGYKDVAANSTAANDSPFGIVLASEIFIEEVDSTKEGTESTVLKTVDAEDFDDGARSGEFDESIRFDFAGQYDDETFNSTIDFQAVVMDRAGNVGFSDSDPSAPRFIHEYGVERADRQKNKHNVLGWYSRHILFLDLVDPVVDEEKSATGFYGEDDDGPVRSGSGLMILFDGPVSPDEISASTFDVTLDNGAEANVTDVVVEGRRVFLQLEEDLAADATPKVDLATGAVVRDLAGNSVQAREFEEIELSDGILPTFTLSLSNGSGTRPELGYGPDQITKDRITLTIQSDEAIQGAPRFVVLCENFRWYVEPASGTITAAQIAEQYEDNNIAKFIENRTGSLETEVFGDAEPISARITPDREVCAYEYDAAAGDPNPNPSRISPLTALRRGTNRWEYQWSNPDDLQDGDLTIVTYGRDRGGFEGVGDDPANPPTLVNYGTASIEFALDTDLANPLADDGSGGEVIPAQDESVSEPRPFVLIDFSEETPVTVTQFEVDGVDVSDELEELDNNRFVYWPPPLDIGTYAVNVEANDAADNNREFQYKFTVRERLPFMLNLLPGWNTISFPANPQDRALHAVFTDENIDQVIGWDATDADGAWRMATRIDGVWTTGEDFAVLNDVEARYGYWVHSNGFVTQTVRLVGKADRIGPVFTALTAIDTIMRGWNFIGVVDVDGDQTEDSAGQTLLNSKKAPMTAEQYLGDFRNAYTWNNVDKKWQRLRPDGPVTIGTGIWVYYDKGSDVAP